MSKRIKGITIEIGGETKKLETALKSVNRQISQTGANLRDINKLLKFNPGNTDLLKQRQEALRTSIKANVDKLIELQKIEKELAKDPGQKSKWEVVKREIVDVVNNIKNLNNQQKNLKLEEFESSVRKSNVEIRKTKEELDKVNSVLKESPRNVDLIKQKQELVKQSIIASSEKLKTLRDYEKELAKDPGQKEKWRAVQREILETENRMKSLEKEYSNISRIKLTSLQAGLDSIGNKAQNAADKTKGISTASGLAATAGAKMAIDFESAFAGVKKTVDATDAEFKQLEDNLRSMAKEIPASASELARVTEIAGQLGIRGVENLTDFTKTAIMLGTSTDLSAEEAATSLSQFMNVMRISKDQIGNLGSAVVALGNNFSTNEAKIVEMSQRLSGMGQITKMSGADVLGLATSMSSLGIEAEAGGTAMTQVMKKMQNAVMNGDKKLEEFAKTAKVSTAEFSEAFKNRPVEALQLFLKGLNEASESGENVNAILGELGVKGIRESDAVLRLAGALDGDDGLANALETANKGFNENTALQKEANQRYETTASQLKILKNNAVDFGISIGQALLPTIKKIADSLKSLTQKFQNLSDGQKKFIAHLLIFGASIAPFFIAINKVSRGLSTMIGGIKGVIGYFSKGALGVSKFAIHLGKLKSAILSVISFFAKFGTAVWNVASKIAIVGVRIIKSFSSLIKIKSIIQGIIVAFNALKVAMLSNPFTLIITAIVALGTALYVAYQKSETFRNAVNSVFNTLKTFVLNVWNNSIKPVFEYIKTIWDSIKIAWQTHSEEIKAIFKAIWDGIKLVWETFWTIMKPIIETAWEFLKITFQTLWDAIKSIWDIFAGIFTGDWERVWNGVKDLASTIWEGIKNVITTVIDGIWEFISTIFQNIYNFISEIFNNVWTFISDIWSNIYNTISQFVTDVWKTVVEKVTDIFNSVSEWFGKIPGKISELWGDAVDYLKGIDLFQIGWDIIEGLANGLWNAGKWLWETASNLATGVIDSMKSALGINSPSKVAAELGLWTGEGFEIGLNDTISDVKNTAQKLSDTVVDNIDTNGVKDSFDFSYGANYELRQNSNVVSTLNNLIKEFNSLKQDLNITVISELNGREIARSIHQDIDVYNARSARRMRGI